MSFKLSQPERILLQRRRHGLTQAQAADRFKIPRHIYARIENGKPVVTRKLENLVEWMKGPFVAQDHERCLIMRERCGKTQDEVAADLKCSRYWLNRMETGKEPCDTLLWYWEQ